VSQGWQQPAHHRTADQRQGRRAPLVEDHGSGAERACSHPQEDISKDVTRALSITLDVGDLPRARGGTTNIEAYDKYLRAREATRGGFQGGLPKAVPLLREAVALDPNFQMAWLVLSTMLGPMSGVAPENAAALTQEQAAVIARLDALHLDSQLALTFHAGQSMLNRDWADAVDAVPQLETDKELAALILLSVGRVSDSIPYIQRLVQADPLRSDLSLSLAAALDAAGRSAEAHAEVERGKTLPGDGEEKGWGELFHLWSSEGSDPAVEKDMLKLLLQRKDGAYARLYVGLAGKVDDTMALRAALRFQETRPRLAIHVDDRAACRSIWRQELALAAMRRAYIDMHTPYPALIQRSQPARDPA
jgi:tetratricopeptide (TPR) repeat protein